jgi:hypothetical protein
MTRNYLIDETLDGGRYRLVQPLQLGPYRKLYLAARTDAPEEQFLATVIAASNPPPIEKIREFLGYEIPGVMKLGFIGQFDVREQDPMLLGALEGEWAMLEQIPQGASLRRLLTEPLSEEAAICLALSVGEILLVAASRGVLLTDLRPDYIWARHENHRIAATALTARPTRFFEYQARSKTSYLFTRHYDSPDREKMSVASLTFTLATMMAEWILGEYPFPAPGIHHLSTEQWEGRAPTLAVSQPLAQVLQRGFTADPARRPTLAQFLAELRALRPADLAT